MNIYDRTRELGKERADKKYSKMLKVLANEKNTVEALNKTFDLLFGDKNRTTKAFYFEMATKFITLVIEIKQKNIEHRSFLDGMKLSNSIPDYFQELLESKLRDENF